MKKLFMQQDELVWGISFIIACVSFVPFHFMARRALIISRWSLSLPMFVIAWLVVTSFVGIFIPYSYGHDWLPVGFAAGLLTLMPGVITLRAIGFNDWTSSQVHDNGLLFLILSTITSLLVYWGTNYLFSRSWTVFRRVDKKQLAYRIFSAFSVAVPAWLRLGVGSFLLYDLVFGLWLALNCVLALDLCFVGVGFALVFFYSPAWLICRLFPLEDGLGGILYIGVTGLVSHVLMGAALGWLLSKTKIGYVGFALLSGLALVAGIVLSVALGGIYG